MGQTIIAPGDPKAQKRWSAILAKDTHVKSYFTKKFIGTGDNSIIQRKTELDSDVGDRISFDLSVQLRQRPTRGDNVAEGNEEDMKFFSDEVVIDQLRHPVSAGGKMTRKRTIHDLRTLAKERLSDYWAKYIDELFFIYLSGARGINEDFIEPTNFAGHATNAIDAPDTKHILFASAGATAPTSKAGVTANDVFNRNLVERAATACQMMQALDRNAANMQPVTINGEPHYCIVMSPFQEHSLRTEAGPTGWLEIQKAAAAAEGKSNPIFRGGLGMINNIVLHSHRSVIRFDDYGTNNNLPAARALLLGRQAGVVAYGTAGGLQFFWEEERKDYKNQISVMAGTIVGVKKSRFNGRDFGVIALDSYAKNPEAA